MEMALNIIMLIAGFVALVKGADLFVDGSASLAGIFKIPSVIIGLTIVSWGTSAPELAVSTSAAIQDSNEIALSNVVGSNIFNLIVVLGVCALIKPVEIDKKILKRDFPFSIISSTLLLGVLCIPLIGRNFSGVKLSDNVSLVSRPIGIVLIAVFAVYMTILVIAAKNSKSTDEQKTMSPVKSVLYVLIGLAFIIAGGQFVVNGAKFIAAAFGMSETLIGLTIVAVGTSLPELLTSVVAAKKGENGLAAGNVVGSNMFNILLILGISATLNPIPVNLASLIDFGILTAASILTLIFARTQKINRAEGAVMLAIYVATMVFAIVR